MNCIRVTYFGGSEDVDFDTFANIHIQDYEEAKRIAEVLLSTAPYTFENDDWTTNMMFDILNEKELRKQMEAVFAEVTE